MRTQARAVGNAVYLEHVGLSGDIAAWGASTPEQAEATAAAINGMIAEGVGEALAEAAQELDALRRHLWDACQDDPRRQVAAGAALARGQLLGLLDERRRRRLAEPTPYASHLDDAVIAELDMLAACVAQMGPAVPLPPCELEARVRGVLAWAEEATAHRQAGDRGGWSVEAELRALEEFARRLREALGEGV